MKSIKVSLRFNMNKDADRRAYEFLQCAEVSYSRAVITALNSWLDAQEQQKSEDAFLQRVVDTIRQELRSTAPVAGLLQLLQPVPQESPKPSQEDEDNMMAFLDAFDGSN